jgi:hypothetical protein
LRGRTTCRGGALGTPFALLTDASGPLFAEAFAPDAAVTGDATAITASSATLNGTANPGGAPAATGFDVGPTTAYGQSAAGATFPSSSGAQAFTAALAGLAANTTFHFRAFARSDFATVTGADRTFTTTAVQNPPPANAKPTARIVGLKSKVKRRSLKRIHGTATDPDDGVARVDVAVVRLIGGAKAVTSRKARKRCQVLRSNGRLKTGKRSGGRCRPSFLKAKGTTNWSLKLRKRLPKGKYVAFARATDKAGQRQAGFPKGSRKAFRVR